MKLIYNYEFNKDKCWYRSVCKRHNTSDCNAGCIRYIKFHYLVTMSLLSTKQQKPVQLLCPSKDKKAYERLYQIRDNIKQWVSDGGNLLLCSSITGNGKTTWAIKLLMNYFDEIWAYDSFTVRGLYINVAKLCVAEKENIGSNSDYLEHIKNNIRTADIIIWDDIGIKSLTDFEHDYLYSYINDRILNGKANIFTANGTPEELQKILGDRLNSRVCLDSEIIVLKGNDMRGVIYD